MITIRGRSVEVDVARELMKYEWRKVRWAGEKFLACSPFRDERRPSFAVRLDTGVWIDSGSTDEEWRKGSFVKLLAWLRNETWAETEDYLLSEYASFDLGDVDSLRLDFSGLRLEEPAPEPLDPAILDQYRFRHPYLSERRGIEEKYQRGFRVGYDRASRAVTFPWFDRHGRLVNVKFRSVVDKRFWYLPSGQPIKNHLYGLHHVHRKGERRVFLVESEIDAITLWQAGFPAIALGGASMSPAQKGLILQSPIEELVLATDNDAAGRRIADSVANQLNGYLSLWRMEIPEDKKDVNDLTREELIEAAHNVKPLTIGWSLRDPA